MKRTKINKKRQGLGRFYKKKQLPFRRFLWWPKQWCTRNAIRAVWNRSARYPRSPSLGPPGCSSCTPARISRTCAGRRRSVCRWRRRQEDRGPGWVWWHDLWDNLFDQYLLWRLIHSGLLERANGWGRVEWARWYSSAGDVLLYDWPPVWQDWIWPNN